MDKLTKIINETFDSIVKEHDIVDDLLFLEYLENSVFANLKEVYQPDELIMTPKGQATLQRNLKRLSTIAMRYNTRARAQSEKPRVAGGENTKGDVAQRIVNLMTAAGIHSGVRYPSEGKSGKGIGLIQINKDGEWTDADKVETLGDFQKTLSDEERRTGQATADVSRDELLNNRRLEAQKGALSGSGKLPTIRPIPPTLIDTDVTKRAERLRRIKLPKEVITKHTLNQNTGKYDASHYYDVMRKPPENFRPGLSGEQ
jgi:hypothetical protein